MNAINRSIEEDSFNKRSPTDCGTLRVIGTFVFILFIFSVYTNSVIILVYVKKRSLFSRISGFIIVLACLNLFGSFATLPTVILNSFSCGFVIGKYGCYITSFFMYFTGCFSIYLLVIISFIRYNLIELQIFIN
jgi:hypothetical protein